MIINSGVKTFSFKKCPKCNEITLITNGNKMNGNISYCFNRKDCGYYKREEKNNNENK